MNGQSVICKHGYPDQNCCPRCEIDRLTAQLAETKTANLAIRLERDQALAQLHSQLAERDVEVNKLCELVALHTCHTEQLEQENAALRAEVEKYKCLDGFKQLQEEARKRTAQEIVDMLRSDRWAESELRDIIYKFGLEG